MENQNPTLRKCTSCKRLLLLSADFFYPVKTTRFNGFAYRCIECQKSYDRLREKTRRRKTPARMAANRIRVKLHRERFPEKVSARLLARQAMKSGKLIKEPCEKCGQLKVDAHHDDYSKPLSVRWLCRKHHNEHHYAILSPTNIKE